MLDGCGSDLKNKSGRTNALSLEPWALILIEIERVRRAVQEEC
jgi:hypothetical protein